MTAHYLNKRKTNRFQKSLEMHAIACAIAVCALSFAPAAAKHADTEDAGRVDYRALAQNAVDSPARPDGDRSDDANRKPVDVLAFCAIAPRDIVFEMEAGQGYYTELISKIVGPDGAVIMQSPSSFDSFLAEPVAERLKDNRLANVRLSKTMFDALDAPDGSVDIVTWFLGPHELYFTPATGDNLGDVDTAYAEIHRILKPGGRFIVLDHAAPAGSSVTTGDTLHRIDPAIVKTLAAQTGFELIDENDALANRDDDYSLSVFNPAVRRKTDRFLLKFIKN